MLDCLWFLARRPREPCRKCCDAARPTKGKLDKCVHFDVSKKKENTLVGNDTVKHLGQKLGKDPLKTFYIYEGNPPKWNLFIKNGVFILTILNFSHLQSTLYLMQYTYQDIFFHCSKQFLNSLILMLCSAPATFWFHLYHIGKMVPFEDFFDLGKQKKCCSG